MKLKFFLALLLLSFASATRAQTSSDTLTNKTILDFKDAGFGAEIIKSKIANSPCKFDLSPDKMIALKKAGITDDVISAMLSKGNTASSGKPNQNSSPQGSSGAKVTPGIYYSQSGKDNPTVQLDPTSFSQSKTGPNFFPGFGEKTKTTSIISGSSANFQINEKKPVFWFYFGASPYTGGNFSTAWVGSATNPEEFILIKFNIKRNNREVETGSYGTYSGFSSGVPDKNKVSFRPEKLADGQYKIHFDQPLEAGEYGFMYTGAGGKTTAFQKVFDFGIK
jgi:hypothetical protein